MPYTNIEKVIKAIKKNEPLLIKNFVDNVYKGEIKQLIIELNKCNNLEYNKEHIPNIPKVIHKIFISDNMKSNTLSSNTVIVKEYVIECQIIKIIIKMKLR